MLLGNVTHGEFASLFALFVCHCLGSQLHQLYQSIVGCHEPLIPLKNIRATVTISSLIPELGQTLDQDELLHFESFGVVGAAYVLAQPLIQQMKSAF